MATTVGIGSTSPYRREPAIALVPSGRASLAGARGRGPGAGVVFRTRRAVFRLTQVGASSARRGPGSGARGRGCVSDAACAVSDLEQAAADVHAGLRVLALG